MDVLEARRAFISFRYFVRYSFAVAVRIEAELPSKTNTIIISLSHGFGLLVVVPCDQEPAKIDGVPFGDGGDARRSAYSAGSSELE